MVGKLLQEDRHAQKAKIFSIITEPFTQLQVFSQRNQRKSDRNLMWKQLSLLGFLVGIASAAQPYAELTALKTKNSSASSYEHAQFTKCDGDLFFTVSSVSSSDDSTNGLYRFDNSNKNTHSTQVTKSLGKIRGLTCHDKYLYYFRQTDSNSWGLHRYNIKGSAEEFLHDASELKHEPLVNYEGDLFMAARGPKLYKLTLSTNDPKVGLVWEGPGKENNQVYPESMIVHKNERDSDLYFVAPDENEHPCLWKFNVQNDKATMLKDLVLRTGDSEATIANMISYKGPQDFASLLYFSLGGFEKIDGHHRLATWDDAGSLPVVTLVQGYDPSHLTIYKENLYMVLRNPKDVSQYGVWRWNGRFVKEVFSLPNKGKISYMAVWDDILVVSGDSGPLMVFNGEDAESVSVTDKLTDVNDIIDFDGKLILAATEDPSDQGNGLWSLSKGVWKDPSEVSSEKDSSSSGRISSNGSSGSTKPSESSTNKISASTEDDSDASGNVQPAWSKEISGSGGGGGGVKVIIVLFVLAFVGGLCWWAYKTNSKVERERYGDSGSKNTWSGDEYDSEEGGVII